MPKFFATCLHAHLLVQELSLPTIKSTDTGVIFTLWSISIFYGLLQSIFPRGLETGYVSEVLNLVTIVMNQREREMHSRYLFF